MSTDVKKAEEAAKAYVLEHRLNIYDEYDLDTVSLAYRCGYLAGSAAREGEWVYCADRLPEKAVDCQVAYVHKILGIRHTTFGFLSAKGWRDTSNNPLLTHTSEVYAWRPIQPITPPPIKL